MANPPSFIIAFRFGQAGLPQTIEDSAAKLENGTVMKTGGPDLYNKTGRPNRKASKKTGRLVGEGPGSIAER